MIEYFGYKNQWNENEYLSIKIRENYFFIYIKTETNNN